MKRGLLVTGCGRSGTGFIAKTFEAAGLDAGHERYFTAQNGTWPKSFHGLESSWLAAPFLKQIPKHVHIAHQVRHPVAVIRSFMGFAFFRPDLHSRYVSFAYRHAPAIEDWEDPFDRCIQYWVSWNEMVEQHPGVRTHQLEKLSPGSLRSLARQAGMLLSRESFQEARRKVGERYNHRDRDAAVTAERILERPLGPKVQELATKYGYEMV